MIEYHFKHFIILNLINVEFYKLDLIPLYDEHSFQSKAFSFEFHEQK